MGNIWIVPLLHLVSGFMNTCEGIELMATSGRRDATAALLLQCNANEH